MNQTKLSANQIEENYNSFVSLVEKYISSPRKEKVLEMLEVIGEEMALAPASGKAHYHGAYAGGYLVHVLGVTQAAVKVMKLYQSLGGMIDFTGEELVFSALFHDLGKVGNGEKPAYVPQTSEWHQKNQGSFFINNPEIDFMLVPDRSLYLLQKFGIELSQKEYLAIKLHDGLFEESNKAYYINFSPDARLRSNIVKILHAADLLAAAAEFDKEHLTDD